MCEKFWTLPPLSQSAVECWEFACSGFPPRQRVFVVGKVLGLLENWRGASFADVNQQTGFGEPGKGAPHGNENTGFAAHT